MSLPPLWEKHFLPGADGLVESWMEGAQVLVRLSRSRVTKHGDYRFSRNGRPSVITINQDLHPVLFTITFAHELAHYRAGQKYGQQIRPHGPEWKYEFRVMLKELIESKLLSEEVAKAVIKCFFRRESIGSGSCEALLKAIGLTGGEVKIRRVVDVPEGKEFKLRSGRVFVKGAKARTRYHCIDKQTGRTFAVNPMAEIVD